VLRLQRWPPLVIACKNCSALGPTCLLTFLHLHVCFLCTALLSSAAGCAVGQAQGLIQTLSKRRPLDLLRCMQLVHGVGEGHLAVAGGQNLLDWAAVGEVAVQCSGYQPCSGISTMLGPLASDPKLRKAAQVRG
jgi:hypothetical protein